MSLVKANSSRILVSLTEFVQYTMNNYMILCTYTHRFFTFSTANTRFTQFSVKNGKRRATEQNQYLVQVTLRISPICENDEQVLCKFAIHLYLLRR